MNGLGPSNDYSTATILNMGIFNILRTGNPLIDAILLSIVGAVVANNVTKLVNFISNFSFESMYYMAVRMIKRIYNYLTGKKNNEIVKYVHINAISDERKANELYDAVYWYITNTEIIDFIKETPIKFSYDKNPLKTLNPEETEIKLNKVISRYKEKKITYNGHEITYMLSSEVITVYSDEERKKENRSIQLNTKILDTDTVDILDEFCTHCVKKYVEFLKNKNWEPMLYHNSNGDWKSKPLKNKRRIETIILPHDTKKRLMADLSFFVNKKEWFNNIGIPYTRGYLFYGPPGVGKTSLIKGISNYCKRNIHYLILNDVKNDVELYNLLAKIDYSSTILVIEDIDCASEVTKKRKNKIESNKLDDSLSSENDSDNDNDNHEKMNSMNQEISKLKEELSKMNNLYKQNNNNYSGYNGYNGYGG